MTSLPTFDIFSYKQGKKYIFNLPRRDLACIASNSFTFIFNYLLGTIWNKTKNRVLDIALAQSSFLSTFASLEILSSLILLDNIYAKIFWI